MSKFFQPIWSFLIENVLTVFEIVAHMAVKIEPRYRGWNFNAVRPLKIDILFERLDNQPPDSLSLILRKYKDIKQAEFGGTPPIGTDSSGTNDFLIVTENVEMGLLGLLNEEISGHPVNVIFDLFLRVVITIGLAQRLSNNFSDCLCVVSFESSDVDVHWIIPLILARMAQAVVTYLHSSMPQN